MLLNLLNLTHLLGINMSHNIYMEILDQNWSAFYDTSPMLFPTACPVQLDLNDNESYDLETKSNLVHHIEAPLRHSRLSD